MSFFSRKKKHPSSHSPSTSGLIAHSTGQQPPPQLSQLESHSQPNQQLSTSNPSPTNELTTSQSTQQKPSQRQPLPHTPQANNRLSTSNSSPTDTSPINTSQSTQKQPAQEQPFPTRSQSQSQYPQANQQPLLLCTWFAHPAQPESSPSPLPRHGHALTATATAAGELFLFGGYIHDSASDDLYIISTRDLSASQLRVRGDVPGARIGHAAVLTSTILLIWGGKTNFSDQNASNQRQDDSLNLLNLVSQEWTRVVINGPGPGGRYFHTVTMVGSKFFVCGGQIGKKILSDMWAFDLNSLKSQPFWESYEPAPGDKKPFPRAGHVSVTTGEHIIIFGGNNGRHFCNDTWSFDISTRKWTEIQCTGSIPSPRGGHAAVLVDNVMYVYGGWTLDKTVLDDLIALQLSTQQWFKFQNVGKDPGGRSSHAMTSDGTRIFVLGGITSTGDQANEAALIHVFDTKHIKYLEPDPNVVNPSDMTMQLAQTSFPTLEQPQHPTSFSLDAQTVHGVPFQNAILGESIHTVQMNCERNLGLNLLPSGVNDQPRHVPEDDDGRGSTEYRTMFVTPDPYSGGVARLELERLSVSLAERDRRIAQLTDELAQKNALLERAEMNAAEAKKHEVLELRELQGNLERQLSVRLAAQTEQDRRIVQLTDELARKSALLEQAEANATEAKKHEELKLHELQATLDELLLSRDQHVRAFEQAQSALQIATSRATDAEQNQYAREQIEMELAEVRAELEEKKSELEVLRSRLTDAENGWTTTKNKAEADTLRVQTATGSANTDDGEVTRRLMERMRLIEAELESRRWNEKSIEEMVCRNEG